MEILSGALSCCKEQFERAEDVEHEYQEVTITTSNS